MSYGRDLVNANCVTEKISSKLFFGFFKEMKRWKMLPAYQKLKDENGFAEQPPLFQVSFSKFSTITVALPLLAFIFCVGYSLIFFFHASTATHCHVWNYLPSISVSASINQLSCDYRFFTGGYRLIPASGYRVANFYHRSLHP